MIPAQARDASSPGLGRTRLCKVLHACGIEGAGKPVDTARLHGHHIKAAWRQGAQAHQVVACGKHNAHLLGPADAGGGPAMAA